MMTCRCAAAHAARRVSVCRVRHRCCLCVLCSACLSRCLTFSVEGCAAAQAAQSRGWKTMLHAFVLGQGDCKRLQ